MSNRYCEPLGGPLCVGFGAFCHGMFFQWPFSCMNPFEDEDICICEACGWHPCEDLSPLKRKRSPYDDAAGRWFR